MYDASRSGRDDSFLLDCLIFGLDCLISGLDCLISGLDCLLSGLDCLMSGLDCLVKSCVLRVEGVRRGQKRPRRQLSP